MGRGVWWIPPSCGIHRTSSQSLVESPTACHRWVVPAYVANFGLWLVGWIPPSCGIHRTLSQAVVESPAVCHRWVLPPYVANFGLWLVGWIPPSCGIHRRPSQAVVESPTVCHRWVVPAYASILSFQLSLACSHQYVSWAPTKPAGLKVDTKP